MTELRHTAAAEKTVQAVAERLEAAGEAPRDEIVQEVRRVCTIPDDVPVEVDTTRRRTRLRIDGVGWFEWTPEDVTSSGGIRSARLLDVGGEGLAVWERVTLRLLGRPIRTGTQLAALLERHVTLVPLEAQRACRPDSRGTLTRQRHSETDPPSPARRRRMLAVAAVVALAGCGTSQVKERPVDPALLEPLAAQVTDLTPGYDERSLTIIERYRILDVAAWVDADGDWCAADVAYVNGDRFDAEQVAILSALPVCAPVELPR